MNKVLTFILMVYSCMSFSHEPGSIEYNLGAYEDSPFEYPTSLSEEKISIIVNEMNRISVNKIVRVEAREDFLYEVTVCTHFDSDLEECDKGETYIFGQGRERFANFSITPHNAFFISPQNDKDKKKYAKEYSKGAYSNLPFYYLSSISEAEVDEIVRKVGLVSDGEIMQVTGPEDGVYRIRTCISGARYNYLCGSGESFTYDIKKSSITKNGGVWIQ